MAPQARLETARTQSRAEATHTRRGGAIHRRWLTAAFTISGALVALGGTFAGGDGVATAAAVVSEERSVEAIEELELSGIGTLTLTQGETESLSISAEADILPKITSEVRDGRLTIEPQGSFTASAPVTYELTVTDLTTIVLGGSAAIEGEEFATKRLKLEVEGSATLKLDTLTADELAATIEGAADVELAGTVQRQEIELGGSATYLAEALASEEASIKAEGSSEATLNVSDTLEAEVGGAATVAYRGEPTVRDDISGAGSLDPLD